MLIIEIIDCLSHDTHSYIVSTDLQVVICFFFGS